MTMNDGDLERVVAIAAKKAVEEVIERMGLDVSNVRESQSDFAYLRKQRLASEQITRLALRTVISVFLTGVCAVFVLGIKEYFNQ